ncbi:MAG: hypothetical protein COA42_21480 [Alteromonadaceae bacterium]|nr:MAG: hypothetical protein COA42_21480 [Alteromonadaceae bacterium]
MPQAQTTNYEALVTEARDGNKDSMSQLISKIRNRLYAISVKYLWHPHDAEDACQEILIRIVKNLHTFRGDSQFETWAHRIAINTLINIRKQASEPKLSFEDFSADLEDGLAEAPEDYQSRPDYHRMLEEIRTGCTSAMLQCLEGDLRLSYIMGEILEFDHNEAATILEVQVATYRKRLSRSRDKVNAFMQGNCGLINPENSCRCNRRVSKAIATKRLDPGNYIFSTSQESADNFPIILEKIRNIKDMRSAALLHQTSSTDGNKNAFSTWLKEELLSINTDEVS